MREDCVIISERADERIHRALTRGRIMRDNFTSLEHAPELHPSDERERMLAEGNRSARMLGTVLVALAICAVLIAVALAWPVL